jgi:poly-gamma-glutamate synthesis protein (capsule biosynthesis protein)
MAQVVIGGDVVPQGRALPAFESGDAAAVFGDLVPEFERADVAVVNLECPLIERPSPIDKYGSNLGAPTSCIRAVAAAAIDTVNLANNHVLDHGPAGLESTLRACRAAGVRTVGAGEDREAAAQPLIRDVKGVRLAIVAMAEHEFSIAGRDSPGAAGLDLAQFMRIVRQHRGSYDFLVVLLHGGSEHHPYPSPRLMETCRFLVEEGAGAVVCQHSHCAGCWEMYRGAPIVYGQGNLVFDEYRRADRMWCEGFLVRLELGPQGRCEADIVPYVQGSVARAGAHRMGLEDERCFRRAFLERSKQIGDEQFVLERWQEFCRQREGAYLGLLHGHGPLMRRLHARLGWLRRVYSRRKRLILLDLVQCEAHREAIQTICRLPVRP